MMSVDAIEDDLAKRFRIDLPPTLLARKSSKARIGFSRMQSGRPMRSRSLAAPPEEAFAFHVPLAVPFFSNLWTAGKRREVPNWRLGDAQLIDLRDKPTVSLDIPFASLRFYMPQTALDEMANEAGIQPSGGIMRAEFRWPRSGHVRPGANARWRDGAARRRHRHVFRLYRASFLRSRHARLRQNVGRWAKHPWLPCAVAAAARLRLHHRQSGR